MGPERPNKPERARPVTEFWSLVDGLKDRGLLSRAALIKHGDMIVELREPSIEPSKLEEPKELTPEQEKELEDRIQFAASSRD